MASTEHDSKGGAIELADKHPGSGNAEIDLQSEEDLNVAESRMSLAKWMACLALGLSYTTAIQQHSCTATIVKHIDIALGNFKDENVWCTLTQHRADDVLQLDNQRPQRDSQSNSTTGGGTFRHLRPSLLLSRGLYIFTHWDHCSSGSNLDKVRHSRHGAQRDG